ncbi:TRAP transporter small permease [Pseudonocardia sp. C8]|uniref:TRAP transporter small permease n=1 Tax=Pseudonocardia sp. C8 TaxID=2762759 RepID=UPI001642AC23|nr:TRAP transporter small permease [Pseudonocardia sp. C8]MBC3191798.1 TRAP transporter small permease [Pseudonocardia sp. C8]
MSTPVETTTPDGGVPARSGACAAGRRLEGVATAVSGTALVLIGVVTIAEVVMRYVVGAPLSWVLGLITDYLLPAMFFFGLSYAYRTGSHVSIDFLHRTFPPRVRRVVDVMGTVLALGLFVLLGTAGLLSTHDAWSAGEIPPPGGAELPLPTWTSLVLIPLGVLVLVVRILHTLISLVRGEQPEEDR